MINKFKNLSSEQSNLVILKVLCIIEDKSYCKIQNWPFEDITIDDLASQINKIYSNKDLKKRFIDFCLIHIEKKKQYSLIEGLFNLITIFEELERYEECIVLKNIKDYILLDLQHAKA